MVFETEEELVYCIKANFELQKKREWYEDDIEHEETIDLPDENLKISVFYEEVLPEEYIVDFDFILSNIIEKLELSSSRFEKKFFRYEINNIINFSYFTFKRSVSISDGWKFGHYVFNKTVDFTNCTFDGETNFSRATFISEVDFSESEFKFKADFSRVTFKLKAIFFATKFYNLAVFLLTEFSDEVDFSYSKISDTLRLKDVEFLSKNVSLNFDDIVFENERSYLYLSMRKNIDDKGENKENCIKLHSISFKNVLINGRIDIRNLQCNNTNFKGTATTGVFTAIDCKFGKFKNWQTARFFKHEAIKINDTIKTLKYKAREVNLYNSKLRKDLKKKLKCNKRIQKFAELSSININGFFSNHGQNWVQAVGATLLVGFLFYSVVYMGSYIVAYNKYGHFTTALKLFSNGLIKYFIPLDFKFLKFNNPIENAILILGKIATWYGGVQVVSSFRKYNKY